MISVEKIGGSILPKDGSGYDAVLRHHHFTEKTKGKNIFYVISAPQGMTNALFQTYDRAMKDEGLDVGTVLGPLFREYKDVFDYSSDTMKIKDDLALIIRQVRETYVDMRDLFVSKGETTSGKNLVSRFEQQDYKVVYYDGPKFGIQVDEYGRVKYESSFKKVKEILEGILKEDSILVIGGFAGYRIGSDGIRHMKLMERNETDTTQATVGRSLVEILGDSQVECVNYKDSAVRMVDPAILDSAFVPYLNYDEAKLVGNTGSVVVHPNAVDILKEGNIPLYVKKFLNENEMTVIYDKTFTTKQHPVAVITAENVIKVGIKDREANYPGYLRNCSGVIANRDANIKHHYGSTDEVNLTFTPSDYKKIEGHIFDDLVKLNPNYNPTIRDRELAAIGLIGERMDGTVGVWERIGRAMRKSGISIEAIVQNDEEPGLFIFVNPDKKIDGVKAAYEEFRKV